MATLAKLRSLAEEYTAAEKAKYDSLRPVLSDKKLTAVFNDIDAILEKESKKGLTKSELMFSSERNHPRLESRYFVEPTGFDVFPEVVPTPISEWWNQLNNNAHHQLRLHREGVYHMLIGYIVDEWRKRSDVPVTYRHETYPRRSRVLFDWSSDAGVAESNTKRARIGEDKEMRLN